jgi:hypothetical protein
VVHEEDADAAVDELPEAPPELAGFVSVETGRRFVEDEDVGPAGHRPGEGQQPAVAL